MRTTCLAVTVALTVSVFAAGCERHTTPKVASPTLLTINGEPVSESFLVRAGLQDRLRAGPEADEAALERQVQDKVVATVLLAQAARRAGLDQSPEVADALHQKRTLILAQAFVAEVAGRPVSDADLARAYTAWAAGNSREYEAAHILLPSEAAARDAIAQLREGADFARLAETLSQDWASARDGGRLGRLRPDALEAPVAAALTNLAVGGLSSDPVRSRRGWHVLKVESVHEVTPDPLAKVRARLIQKVQADRVKQEMDAVRRRARVDLQHP